MNRRNEKMQHCFVLSLCQKTLLMAVALRYFEILSDCSLFCVAIFLLSFGSFISNGRRRYGPQSSTGRSRARPTVVIYFLIIHFSSSILDLQNKASVNNESFAFGQKPQWGRQPAVRGRGYISVRPTDSSFSYVAILTFETNPFRGSPPPLPASS